MKGVAKIWSTIVDYFLVLGAIIGVGFASGKEIEVFFFNFGAASIFGLISFGLLYIYLFLVIQHISKKLELNNYNEFNKKMFGRLCKITNFVLFANFAITSAGMLAGADYLFQTFFNVGYKTPSIVLSIITFFLLLGGMNKIKFISNIIVPIMIAAIVINSIQNINPNNVNLPIIKDSGMIAIYYGLLFGVNNFIAALPVLLETKLKTKGKLFLIVSICTIILLNVLVLASNTFASEMPMFELSINVSSMFYYIYFLTLILALFSTLMICSFNMYKILSKNKKSIYFAILIIVLNLIFSNLGYAFIVQYLYVLSGIISGVYIIALLVAIFINLLNLKQKN